MGGGNGLASWRKILAATDQRRRVSALGRSGTPAPVLAINRSGENGGKGAQQKVLVE
jgi:hypothetical protein